MGREVLELEEGGGGGEEEGREGGLETEGGGEEGLGEREGHWQGVVAQVVEEDAG